MPQGKGTYGSKVGRPPKKKYQVGGVIDEPALEAAQMGQELESIPLQSVEPEFPIVNAMDRSEVSPMGDEVGTGVYKEGGLISKASDKAWEIKEDIRTRTQDLLHRAGEKKQAKKEAKKKALKELERSYEIIGKE